MTTKMLKNPGKSQNSQRYTSLAGVGSSLPVAARIEPVVRKDTVAEEDMKSILGYVVQTYLTEDADMVQLVVLAGSWAVR